MTLYVGANVSSTPQPVVRPRRRPRIVEDDDEDENHELEPPSAIPLTVASHQRKTHLVQRGLLLSATFAIGKTQLVVRRRSLRRHSPVQFCRPLPRSQS